MGYFIKWGNKGLTRISGNPAWPGKNYIAILITRKKLCIVFKIQKIWIITCFFVNYNGSLLLSNGWDDRNNEGRNGTGKLPPSCLTTLPLVSRRLRPKSREPIDGLGRPTLKIGFWLFIACCWLPDDDDDGVAVLMLLLFPKGEGICVLKGLAVGNGRSWGWKTWLLEQSTSSSLMHIVRNWLNKVPVS